jgi:hypothetical protein
MEVPSNGNMSDRPGRRENAHQHQGGTIMASLTEEVESRVRETTHGRIRDLTVHEVRGRILIRGLAPTHHARQLALYGALQLLSGDQLRAEITVGKWGGGDRSTRGERIDRVRPCRPLIPQSDRGRATSQDLGLSDAGELSTASACIAAGTSKPFSQAETATPTVCFGALVFATTCGQ